MKAIISGVDGIALGIDDETKKFFLFRLDDWPPEIIPLEIPSLAYHMWLRQISHNHGVLRHEESSTEDEIIELLKEEWTHDRIISMLQISSDTEADTDLRHEAAEILNELLIDEKTRAWFDAYDPKQE